MDTDSMSEKCEEVFAQLKQFIAEIIGEDVVEQIDIKENSIFTKDLEMDSIEIVSFAEKVKGKYGQQVDFIPWLSGMDLQQLLNLSINQVVEYIVNELNKSK